MVGLGWWVVVVGTDRNWREAEWAKPFKAVLGTVPTDPSLTRYYGHAVGLIYLSDYRVQQECNGYKWAGRDSVCHVVSHAVKFLVSIKIKPPKGFSQQRWEIETDEQALLRAHHGLQTHLGRSTAYSQECGTTEWRRYSIDDSVYFDSL